MEPPLPTSSLRIAHSLVSGTRRVPRHRDLPSSPHGESPMRTEFVKAFAERNGCKPAWGSQVRMHCGNSSPTPPVCLTLDRRLPGRSSLVPACLSSSPESSPARGPLTPRTAYGIGVLDALIKAGASHPACSPGTRRKGAHASLAAIDASVSRVSTMTSATDAAARRSSTGSGEAALDEKLPFASATRQLSFPEEAPEERQERRATEAKGNFYF